MKIYSQEVHARVLPIFLKNHSGTPGLLELLICAGDTIRSKSLHPDRTSRLPLHVQYVANKVLAGLRYYMELYINLNHGGPVPSIDAPISADYPPYNSAEFAARCKVQSEDLTQDPFVPSPPQNNPNEVDEESFRDTRTVRVADMRRRYNPKQITSPRSN